MGSRRTIFWGFGTPRRQILGWGISRHVLGQLQISFGLFYFLHVYILFFFCFQILARLISLLIDRWEVNDSKPIIISSHNPKYYQLNPLPHQYPMNIYQQIMQPSIFLLCTLLTLSLSQNLPPQNPVIGIFTQTHTNTSTSKTSYIAASYVKFIQMSGAQVVPIYSFADTAQVLALMGKINGVLFPGGGMEFSLNNQWTKNADAILKYAKQQNDQGNPFPVFGTCLGAQLLSYLTSNYNDTILTRVHGDQAVIHPLNFVNESYLFATFTPTQKEKVTKGNGVMYFNHNWAVSLDTFNTNMYLKNFWNLVSTATSPQSEKFVASIQAKKYPFYGVQFHPEKNLFEWKVYADRSLEGAEVVQIISNRFVEIARYNKNRFASPEEFTKASIYNFKTQPTDMSFTEIYVFNETPRLVDE